MKWKEIFKLTWIPVLFASLCCLSPIILLLLGLSTVTFAASLTNVLYGDYKWAFRGLGLLLLVFMLVIYFRKKNICTLKAVKKNRNTIINTILIVLIISILAYMLWLYVIIHIIGALLNIWAF